MNYFVSSGFREHEGGSTSTIVPSLVASGGRRRGPEQVWVVVVQAAGAMPRILRAVGTSDEGVTGQCPGETGGLTHREGERV